MGIFVLIVQISSCKRKDDLNVPKALKIAHTEILNDDVRTDYYYWLRNIDNPDVRKYLAAEKEYTDRMMERTIALQEKLFEEFCGRRYDESLEIPQQIGEYFYYKKINQGEKYYSFCRKQKSLEAAEEVILNPNNMVGNHEYFKIPAYEISPDQRFLAFCVDTVGDESHTIYFKDLISGRLLKDRILNAAASFIWANDNKTLFYCKIDASNHRNRVYKHRLGDESGKDEFVYYEKDDSYSLLLYKSESQKYIFIGAGNASTTETYYINADIPDSKPKLIYPRQTNMQYYAHDAGDKFYILTNDKAKNFKVVVAPIANPSRQNWKDVIPHRQQIKVDEIKVFRNYLVMFERELGISKIEVMNLTNKNRHYVNFDEAAYSIRYDINSKFESNILRFSYSSLTMVPSLFDYNMDTREKTNVPGIQVMNYNPLNYTTEKIFASSADGKQIPLIIAYKKGIKNDGSNPLLLTGYGAYAMPNEAKFSSEIISLLDRGFIYAIAHIRGGGEIDDEWYEEGKLLKKKNTFTDFIACAEFLINKKYTSKAKLAIWGRSAGGLLIGSVINMRPDLFKVAVPEVPFVDVLNTMLDPSLYGTVAEYEEWGNPNDKVFYDYIKSYSPYDNVKEQSYPDMLIIGSLNDQRVSFWEPLKWTAKLREKKKDTNLLLLKIYESGGHKGASSLLDSYYMTAFKYAFILDRLGIEK